MIYKRHHKEISIVEREHLNSKLYDLLSDFCKIDANDQYEQKRYRQVRDMAVQFVNFINKKESE